MIVIPAIDLMDGKCVRLRHGKKDDITVYSDDPVQMAKTWAAAGAKRLHVIDLDGAFEGHPKNLMWVGRIKKETGLFIQMGGGLRKVEYIDAVLNAGIDRVILGTIVLEEAGLAEEAFRKYKEKIMVALDVKDGQVAIRGWKDDSGFPLPEAIKIVEKLGGKEIIFTDINRDGTLEGVNYLRMADAMALTNINIIASGGVSSIEDIKKLKSMKVNACIVGKAIYENRLDLAEAIRIAEN
jgi:phosphoribosylformimino-5-aminoimidazole carboxamide ribotide isomerase